MARCGWFRAGPDPLGERRIPTAGCDEGGAPSARSLGQVCMVPRRARRLAAMRVAPSARPPRREDRKRDLEVERAARKEGKEEEEGAAVLYSKQVPNHRRIGKKSSHTYARHPLPILPKLHDSAMSGV